MCGVSDLTVYWRSPAAKTGGLTVLYCVNVPGMTVLAHNDTEEGSKGHIQSGLSRSSTLSAYENGDKNSAAARAAVGISRALIPRLADSLQTSLNAIVAGVIEPNQLITAQQLVYHTQKSCDHTKLLASKTGVAPVRLTDHSARSRSCHTMPHSPKSTSPPPTPPRRAHAITMEECVLRPPNSHLFSDNVIGGVVQRSRTTPGNLKEYRAGQDQWPSLPRKQREAEAPSMSSSTRRWRTHQVSPGALQVDESATSSRLELQGSGGTYNARTTMERDQNTAMVELAVAERSRLRELRRMRQIRYRKKKENYMLSLEEETRQLRNEVEQLEQRRRSVLVVIPAKESAWSVVAEYFRLFHYGMSELGLPSTFASTSSASEQPSAQSDFLRMSMTPDVTFNAERGVEAMLKSWSCISRWFTGVEMVLERLEKDALGALVANTLTSVTITVQTLRIVFPHLNTRNTHSRYLGGTASSLAERLVDQTIIMRGVTRFEWDPAHCRVVSVESESDMISPMLHLLGSLEDVSRVFSSALITPAFQLKSSP
ncbi:unnamed protein product [Phytophthora fragariaefolia]|uniref:Unnamed protein product n=1 Tax=Phytophthora fragariaefolia TaxID=1490495 RepID=A0A9W6UD29_9STRA|nr:unnamed protein product [Phytophthora fragariaefolia]